MRTVSHWIGGKPATGASTRTSPVWNPATGQQQAEVLLAGTADVDAAVQAAKAAFETWGQSSLSQRTKVLFAFRELVNARTARARRDHLRRARQGGLATRGARCSAASRSSSSPAASRRCSRASTPTRSPRASTSTRSASRSGVVRRHHAVQLPGHGADVDVPGRHRLRQHVRAQAERARPAAHRCWSPSCGPRPACPTASSTSCTATRWRSTRCSTTRTSRRSRSSARRPIARYIHERGTANGKRVQALGGAKNHAIVLPDADVDFASDHLVAAAFGSAGERCMAISAAVAVGSARATRSSRRSARRRRASGSAPAATPRARWARSSRARRATGSSGLIGTGRGAGRRRCGVDGRGLVGPRPRGRLLRRPDGDRRRRPGDGRLHARRSSGRCCRWCAPTPSTRRSRSSTPTRTATAPRSSPPAARPPRRFQRGVHVGMIGINVPIPVPMAYYSFGGWKDSLFGEQPHPRPRGRRVLHPREGRHVALAAGAGTPPARPSTSRRPPDERP